MKKFIFHISYFILSATACTSLVQAQNLLPSSARNESLGGADAAFGRSNFLSENPATGGNDSLSPLHLQTSYAPEYAHIQTANKLSAGIGYLSQPLSTLLSLSFSRLSYEDIFSDQVMLLGASHHFDLDSGRSASLGVRLRYESVSFTASYPTVHFFIADFGVQFSLTKEFSLGTYALNILGSKFTTVSGDKEEIERTFGIGVAYTPEETGLSLFTKLDKGSKSDLSAYFGAEYFPVGSLALRIGTTSEFTSVSGGIGLKYDILSFDFGARYSGDLGTNLIFSIGASL